MDWWTLNLRMPAIATAEWVWASADVETATCCAISPCKTGVTRADEELTQLAHCQKETFAPQSR